MGIKRFAGFIAGFVLSASFAFAQSAPTDVVTYGGGTSSGGAGACTGAFCTATAPLSASLGGNGLDNSAATGLPLWTAGTQSIFAPAAGVVTFLTTPSSANLRGALTDETGTGLAYFQGGALGTPSSGTATNITGLIPSSGLAATGSPSITTILYGDNTWKTAPTGTVSSVATGACLTGGTITTTGTIAGTYVINAQTGTTYTFVAGDACNLVTFSNASSIAVTLPQATGSFAAGWSADVQNKGAGTVTITPTTSTINGAATLVLTTNQGCTIVSDGTNYQVSACTAVGGGGVSLAGTNTWTGANTFSFAGAASTPGLSVTGTPFVGTGTTGTPQLYVNNGSAPTTWSTAGTAFGINTPNTAGNAIDVHKNGGTSIFSVDNSGNGIFAGTLNAGNTGFNNIGLNSGSGITWNARSQILTLADGQFLLGANNGTSQFDILQFGNVTASYPGLKIQSATELASSAADKSVFFDFGFRALINRGATPTITGTCTTGSKTGGQTAGTFTATCTAQTVIMTFLTTAPTGWACFWIDRTTKADLMQQASSTTTSCTSASTTTTASDVMQFTAVAYLVDPLMIGFPANDNRKYMVAY